MCTRYRSPLTLMKLAQRARIFNTPNYEMNFSVAPTDVAPVLLSDSEGQRKMILGRFGIKPVWSKKPILNAQRETVKVKKTFKDAYNARRCIIPAQGIYEWREEDGKSQPYYIYRKDDEPLLIAGLYEYAEVNGEKVTNFYMLTGEPNSLVAQFHDRMIIVTEDIDRWLDPTQDAIDTIAELPLDHYAIRPMLQTMNSPKVKDPTLIDPEYVAIR